MTKKEFAMWQAITKDSQFRWTEDEIYRLNGRGAFYYTGGEDGIYMKIQNDGMLEAGNYEGAIPHIGEAFFKPAVQRQCKDYNEAYTTAMEAGGKQFLIDMLTQPDFIIPEPDEEVTVNFYCPLSVKTEDGDYEYDEEPNFVDLDSGVLLPHEEQIRAALAEEMARGGGADMASYYDGIAKDKLLSAKWDVEAVGDELYGVIHTTLTEPLTEEETADLAVWISGQNSDGLLENFGEEPFDTADGNLYVDFWDSGDDYFVLDEDAFWDHINDDQQMGGLQ